MIISHIRQQIGEASFRLQYL